MIKKLSPCQVILIAVVLLLLVGAGYMLWPHSFAALQPDCDSITLLRTGDDKYPQCLICSGAERNTLMKSQKNQKTQKSTNMTTGISLGLAIGLSLGVLIGLLTDNIGLGMMIGTAVGLCGGSAAGAPKGKKEEASDEERKNDDK